MSKILKFRNGHEIAFTEGSSIYDCKTVLTSFAEIDPIWAEFTEENLKGATFDGVAFTNIVPMSISVAAVLNENVIVDIISREKTHDEIVDEQLLEIQTAIAEIVE